MCVSLPRAFVTVCLSSHECTACICIKKLEVGISSILLFLKEELITCKSSNRSRSGQLVPAVCCSFLGN